MRSGLLCLVSALVFAALPGLAQDAPHWGVETDGGFGFVPSSLFQSSQNRYKASGSLNGYDYSVGLVRFHANGAPSYSLDFSGTHFEGNATDSRSTATYNGSTTFNGFMATKYVNFVARRRFSIGMGFGAGIAPQLKLDYTKTQTVGTTTTIVNKQYTVNEIPVTPLFQIQFRGDIRVSRNISVGPWGGFRNGLPTIGGVVRVHFLK